ncbi:SAE2-domain-containing protein [Lindgomyces ingoldianus]|uniref:SAE2-domain-containing protein n=1 Tax=Lindgomyces ingoldianus TaxID=673940 RepID=A0ACB6QXJ8_9PLEO|nr:SAE2-domain-containing protein [Lindgomyces ingoldianus]KAF2471293.1 SAE2-domain-containing protein [Lindgomyces ingoldianus]
MSGDSAWLEKRKHVWVREFGRVYDEVIADWETELKRRHEEQQQELKRRDEAYQIISDRIIEELLKNSHLIEENIRLQDQIKNLQGQEPKSSTTAFNSSNSAQEKRNSSLSTAQLDANPTHATMPCNEYRHLANKYNELNKVHKETIKQLKYQQRKNIAVMEKNREMKKSVKDWQEYTDRHLKKKTKSEGECKSKLDAAAMLSDEKDRPTLLALSSPGTSDFRPPASFPALDRLSPLPTTPDALERPGYVLGNSGDTLVTNTTGVEHHQNEDRPQNISHDIDLNLPESHDLHQLQSTAVHKEVTPSRKQPNSDKITSSQLTEDEIAPQKAPQNPLTTGGADDDTPEIVSERSLKRKRANTRKLEVYAFLGSSDGTPAKPYGVKEEPFSSPPLPNTHQLLRKETFDLDELGPNMISTPHRRFRSNQLTCSDAVGPLRHQRSTSVLIIKEEVTEGTDQGIDTNGSLKTERAVVVPMAIAEARAYSEPTDQARNDTFALQPLDPNARTANRVDDETPHKRQKREDARFHAKYQTLTESGDELPPLDEKDLRLAPSAAREKFNRRLQADREAQTSAKSTSKTHLAATNAKSSARQIPTTLPSVASSGHTPSPHPGSRKSSLLNSHLGSKAGPVSKSPPAPNPRLGSRKGPATKQKQSPPSRSKPYSELKTSDFKPNPAYNQGYSYAFAETIRKRADRACLPGCTKPECCGSTFRMLAAEAPPLSSSQEEALLEDYLGDAYDTMLLTRMSTAERQELVLDARTKQMADKHGRHRHAYERRPSPPGFWRTDFPTTQEEQEDRQKAIEMEKRLVGERYMETMKKGGRWIFRDE